MAKKKSAVDFEQSLQTLEQLVESMEGGDMTLEKSLEAFEQGIKLTKECQQALREAEQKVEILLNQNGEEQLTPFAEDKSEDDAD
ncbi:MAG: exodeoxyribonuclease VII small subunit [Pseudomonadales bacterium]|nr:exodeoxyribonuclease VII small subunit [Pseudomonadales bacterium]